MPASIDHDSCRNLRCVTNQPVCDRQQRVAPAVGSPCIDHDVLFSTGYLLQPPPPARVQTLYGPRYFDHTRYSPSDGGNLAVGALYITLTQGSLSKTTLSEDDPLDIPEFISSIGGFWGECTGPSGPRKAPVEDFSRQYLG